MLVVIFGTTGELIKLAPVLRRLEQDGDRMLLVSTNQQVEQIPTMLRDFGIVTPVLMLTNGCHGRDLEKLTDVPLWLASMLRRAPRVLRRVSRAAEAAATRPLVLVHGDTMTTVLGAMIGRLLRLPVAHVEAGLRSGDWRNPFPEELDRLITSKFATLHYAPGAWAAENLRRARASGAIIDTTANTVRDALALVPEASESLDLPGEPFGLVSIHRFELLGDAARLEQVIAAVHRASRTQPILFIDHPVTAAAIEAAGLDRYFDAQLRRVPRQRYFQFVGLLKAARYLVTDSGGSQEECTALGIPCLVHRLATERQDGLDGGPVVLSRMRIEVLEQFLADPEQHRRALGADRRSPSDVIIEDLRRRGFSAPAGSIPDPGGAGLAASRASALRA